MQVNRRSLRLLALAGVVALSLLAAACGGGSGAKSTGTTTSAQSTSMRFSACMRAHGLPNFPDPDSSGRIRITGTGIDRRSPVAQAAYRACRSLAPSPPSPQQEARFQAQLLAFARCMRSHGVPAYPDPEVTGGGIHFNVPKDQIDPHSPVVVAAAAACRSTITGLAGDPTGKLVGGAAGAPGKGQGK